MIRVRFMAAGLALLALAAFAAQAGKAWWHEQAAERDLLRRVNTKVPIPKLGAVICPWLRPAGEPRPLVLLVLGQSNAGNHGGEQVPLPLARPPSVTITDGNACWRVSDPLPGGTGRHQSIWSRLEHALAARGSQREVVLVLLAVESTSIDDWTRIGSPLSSQVDQTLRRLQGRTFDFVLWQQGESDARQGTSASEYVARWRVLEARLRAAGVNAPVLAAMSTRCRNDSGVAVRQAIRNVAALQSGVHLGPDTDALEGLLREDDCHFSPMGLDAAAALWAESITSRWP